MTREQRLAVIRDNLATARAGLCRERAKIGFSLADAAELAYEEYLALSETDGVRDALSAIAEHLMLPPEEAIALACTLVKMISPPLASLLPMQEGGARLVYVRQGAAEEAYRCFAERFSDLTVFYAEDIAGAVGAVSAGEASCCILPYADRDGNPVRSTASLVLAEGLVLLAEAEVGSREELAPLTYALFGHCFLLPRTEKASLTLRLPHVSKSLLFSVADYLGELGAEPDSLSLEAGGVLRLSFAVRCDTLASAIALSHLLFPGVEAVGLTEYRGR